MKINKVEVLNEKIPEVKIIIYEKYCDSRGCFSEVYNFNDFKNILDKKIIIDITDTYEYKEIEQPIIRKPLLQMNESYSIKNVFRGMHIQWNPVISKIVRVVQGNILDFILDIRLNSPTFGKLFAYHLIGNYRDSISRMLFIPNGFAHGFLACEDSLVQYLYTDYYSEDESSINIFDKDVDWSELDSGEKKYFNYTLATSNLIMSDRDRNAIGIDTWKKSINASNFIYYPKIKEKDNE